MKSYIEYNTPTDMSITIDFMYEGPMLNFRVRFFVKLPEFVEYQMKLQGRYSA